MLKVEENIATNIHGSCFYTIDATPHNTLSPFGCIEIHTTTTTTRSHYARINQLTVETNNYGTPLSTANHHPHSLLPPVQSLDVVFYCRYSNDYKKYLTRHG